VNLSIAQKEILRQLADNPEYRIEATLPLRLSQFRLYKKCALGHPTARILPYEPISALIRSGFLKNTGSKRYKSYTISANGLKQLQISKAMKGEK
jgi:hypothetical protein